VDMPGLCIPATQRTTGRNRNCESPIRLRPFTTTGYAFRARCVMAATVTKSSAARATYGNSDIV